MKAPQPAPGLVLRYSYLWARRAAEGRADGDKDRPAVIVIALVDADPDAPRVLVLPITHSPPADTTASIELPPDVAKACGLDEARHWVILSEFNDFVWPGFDLRPVPGRRPLSYGYGFISARFFSTIRDRWLILAKERKSLRVSRD